MIKRCISLTLCIFSAITGFAQSKAGNSGFILLDHHELQTVNDNYHKGNAITLKQVNELVNGADSLLKAGPYSVTLNKTKLAPSNNKHDYVSQAPYWWPDSSKANGKPYIRKDGRRNPEIYLLHDDSQMGKMSSAVKKLALAYYFTGKEQYAQKAATLLKVWFIDTATRMNPNLNYAQYIPGINDGRGIGIIETLSLTTLPDAISLLHNSKYFDASLINGVKDWYKQYAEWMLNSKNGKSERSQVNNHGTNYDLQLAVFALFTDNSTLAKKVINEFTIPRIDQQFTTDGMQPLELVRTRAWDYSNMNLYAWARLAVIADELNIDLWHTQTLDGKGIKGAILFLMPYALKQKTWTYPEIGKFEYGNFKHTVHLAQGKYPDIDFKDFHSKFPVENELEFIE
jgi:hypothetical protein